MAREDERDYCGCCGAPCRYSAIMLAHEVGGSKLAHGTRCTTKNVRSQSLTMQQIKVTNE